MCCCGFFGVGFVVEILSWLVVRVFVFGGGWSDGECLCGDF